MFDITFVRPATALKRATALACLISDECGGELLKLYPLRETKRGNVLERFVSSGDIDKLPAVAAKLAQRYDITLNDNVLILR